MFSISSEERYSICWMEEFPMPEKVYQIFDIFFLGRINLFFIKSL